MWGSATGVTNPDGGQGVCTVNCSTACNITLSGAVTATLDCSNADNLQGASATFGVSTNQTQFGATHSPGATGPNTGAQWVVSRGRPLMHHRFFHIGLD